jgi:hypothetical protein
MSDSYEDLGSFPRFSITPEWSGGAGVDVFTAREPISFNNGIVSIRRLSLDKSFSVGYNFASMSKADEYQLLKFFADRKGRLERFWIPLWFNEFRLKGSIEPQIVEGATEFSIEQNNFWEVFGVNIRIFIKLKNGDMITRRIKDVDLDSRTRLFVNTPFNRDIGQSEIDCFGRYLLARFDQDELELAHTTPALSDCTLSFKELVKEYVLADTIES